jgi:AGZA family xanthine/uracil permease-like MFS transporter
MIASVPQIAVAPVLIIVGVLMMRAFGDLDFSKIYEVIPAIICMLIVAFSFRISLGFSFGIITYVLLVLAVGQKKLITTPLLMIFVVVLGFLYLLF